MSQFIKLQKQLELKQLLSRTGLMKTYKVKLINEAIGLNQTIECAADQYIVEAAKAAGIELPALCAAGACSDCTGKLVKGTINQDDQSFLDDEQIAAGFVLTCVAYPTSNCQILTHQEEELY
jgi:ferredoxin